MKKTIIILIVFLLFLVIPSAAKAGSLQSSLIPENMQWVIHFDMQKFASTQLCDLLLKGDHNKLSKGFRKIHDKLKIDPLKDIQWFTMFGRGKDESTAAWYAKGNFNVDYLLSLLGLAPNHRESQYGKYTIHSWGPQFGAFVNDHLILFTKDENMIKNVLDVTANKKRNIAASSEMMSYLKEIPKGAFFKAVADDISSIVGHHAKPVVLKKARMAFFGIMEKNGNLALKFKLTTDSAETAKNIEQLAQGFIALGKLNQEENDPKAKLLQALNISLRGNTVLAEWSWPSAELVDILSRDKMGFH